MKKSTNTVDSEILTFKKIIHLTEVWYIAGILYFNKDLYKMSAFTNRCW